MDNQDASEKLQRLLTQLSDCSVVPSHTVTSKYSGHSDAILRYLLTPDVSVCTPNKDDDDGDDVLTRIRQVLTTEKDRLSPLDVHVVASQALIWCQSHDREEEDDDNDENNMIDDDDDGKIITNDDCNKLTSEMFIFRSACFGIMCWALQRRPDKATKRWYSCTCETIRLFQRYGVEMLQQTAGNRQERDGDVLSAMSRIWVDYIVPSCFYVSFNDTKQQAAIFCGLVATTLELLTLQQQQQQQPDCDDDEAQYDDSQLSQAATTATSLLAQMIFQISSSTDLVWLHPWRLIHRQSKKKQTRNDHSDFIKGSQTYEESITFWSTMKIPDDCTVNTDDDDDDSLCDPRDYVVSMDTLWDPDELSLLAFAAFRYRPQVWSKLYVWKCWFLHVPTLGSSFPIKAGQLLNNLIDQIPVQTLTRSSQPLETWILVAQSLSKDPMTLRKLFKCYVCVDQVWLLEKLYHRSQVVFRPRWIDCMRDVVEWDDNIALAKICRWLIDVMDSKETSIEVQMSIVGFIRRWILRNNRHPPIPNIQDRIRACKDRHNESGNFDLLTLAFEQLEESLIYLSRSKEE